MEYDPTNGTIDSGDFIILDRTGDEDDALLQQTREDIVSALAPVCARRSDYVRSVGGTIVPDAREFAIRASRAFVRAGVGETFNQAEE